MKIEIMSFEQFHRAYNDYEKLPNNQREFIEKLYAWYKIGLEVGYKNKTREIKNILGLEEGIQWKKD